jgi:hypothetical protein
MGTIILRGFLFGRPGSPNTLPEPLLGCRTPEFEPRMAVRCVLIRAASVGVVASFACGVTATRTRCESLSDAEWYKQQAEHIALKLSIIEEAKAGWWHEVTRRYRAGEPINETDSRGTTLLHLAALSNKRRKVSHPSRAGSTPTRALCDAGSSLSF